MKNLNSSWGLGTDIIEVGRIKKAIERHGVRFLDRLFTEKEIAYCARYRDPIPHYAGRFAAKEAILKALGTGVSQETTWSDIEILNNAQGKPEVYLFGLFNAQLIISISHCKEYATATALLTRPLA